MHQIEELPKVCVILGAGASFDSWNGSSPLLEEEFRPPLARSLFDIENYPNYFRILSDYPGAMSLADELAPLSSSGSFSIEETLKSYADHSDQRIRKHFNHIPPYIRDLIDACTYRYTNRPGCYGQLVNGLLAHRPHHVLFLVLNYDTLLEQALGSLEPPFENISDYIRPSRQAKVVKLHGSINWFFRPGGRTNHHRDWFNMVESEDVAEVPDEIDYVMNNNPGISTFQFGPPLYPIMTAPLAGKDPNSFTCPTSHVDFARDFLGDCHKFLLIGSSGLDDDLRFLLANSIESPRYWIHSVGGSDAHDAYARYRPIFELRSTLTLDFVFDQGFRDYASSSDFEKFVKRNWP